MPGIDIDIDRSHGDALDDGAHLFPSGPRHGNQHGIHGVLADHAFQHVDVSE